MSFLQNLFGKQKRYDRQKTLVRSENTADRLKLAKSKSTQPELLYYLAQNDPDAAVRREVAKNKSTPVHASSVLARDKDIDVRLALSERLIKLLPNLSKDKQSQLYAFAIQALGTLALDEVLKIRIALSSALKEHAHAPPKVVGQLARDIEREVSEPILRFCLALSDDDLLDILQNHPGDWALEAVAGRQNVSENVSRAIIGRFNESAGLALLKNKNALIAIDTLSSIVEQSKTMKSWQKPIAIRKNLPKHLALELAEFVDEAVRHLLMERTDFDKATLEEITHVVHRRLDFIDTVETTKISVEERVRQMIKDKTLNEESLSDALVVSDKELALVSFAALARTSRANMEKIVSLNKPKPIIAACWKAGLSMRTCLRLQKELAHVPSSEIIYPRGGTDYPLDDAEIKFQLKFFDLA